MKVPCSKEGAVMDEQEKFFGNIRTLAESINGLAKSVLPEYKRFAENVILGRITDIHEIEWQLDYMLSFCFNEEILLLYKAILRKLYRKHPDVVKSYVAAYFDMYGDDANEMEEVKNADT